MKDNIESRIFSIPTATIFLKESDVAENVTDVEVFNNWVRYKNSQGVDIIMNRSNIYSII